MRTVEYYDKNSLTLIKRYDSADMSLLYQVLLKYIPKKSIVLDIGFGSGRDLSFLNNEGYDIWGIDPSNNFVMNAKKRFPSIQNHFLQAAVPFDANTIGSDKKFDAIVCIAMWMHLNRDTYADSVASIVSVAKSNATVVISYSEGSRVDDERCFEEVDLKYMNKLFKDNGFTLVETIVNGDSLNRNSLSWVTVVFKHD
ncbi:bifunctional 2-polyprenyl-6-hydroxyphenol methylase/3-demethylubiquinol 3-O-methyltransferase UbiG [Sulfurimonas sp.]|jgi:2-polyprenyl-3-methyl-5-hydroxy-6-metoxy-1,4-benzoquinol methylase|uniref:class I SAM-dependent methyltransferase n=1 Tax=Sulfurimonas sp. TaxID=2022749 RepID=UPI0025D2CB89|nr:class I SAM-dependent methyltransferase [Sulfurimonas sp.]MBT5934392.1 class I SAM-dependent methyltransferase [Sulfurimonas sp.]